MDEEAAEGSSALHMTGVDEIVVPVDTVSHEGMTSGAVPTEGAREGGSQSGTGSVRGGRGGGGSTVRGSGSVRGGRGGGTATGRGSRSVRGGRGGGTATVRGTASGRGGRGGGGRRAGKTRGTSAGRVQQLVEPAQRAVGAAPAERGAAGEGVSSQQAGHRRRQENPDTSDESPTKRASRRNPRSGGNNGRGSRPEALTGNIGNTRVDIRSLDLSTSRRRWEVVGRVTFRSPVRSFTNARGEGQVASFELEDHSGSIRFTSFTNTLARILPVVRVGTVVAVSGGTIRAANRQFNRTSSGVEVTLDRTSSVSQVASEDVAAFAAVPPGREFTKVRDLPNVAEGETVDVVGVVHAVGPASDVKIRSTGDVVKKRSVEIVDDTLHSVQIALWKTQTSCVDEPDGRRHPVVCIRGATRGDFRGPCLNTSRTTSIEVDPEDVGEAKRIREWYEGLSGTSSVFSPIGAPFALERARATRPIARVDWKIGPRRTIEEIRRETSTEGFQRTEMTVRGYLTHVRKDAPLSYPSDPRTKQKVVPSEEAGRWINERSGQTFAEDEIVHRYAAGLRIGDYTGMQWTMAFDESARALLGRPAEEALQLFDTDRTEYDTFVEARMYKPVLLRLEAREDEWEGQKRMKYTILEAREVDFVAESRILLSEIQALSLDGGERKEAGDREPLTPEGNRGRPGGGPSGPRAGGDEERTDGKEPSASRWWNLKWW